MIVNQVKFWFATVATGHVSLWADVLWLVCLSPVVAWTWHVCEELSAVEHFSQWALQDLIDHTLLHVHQHRLWIQICEYEASSYISLLWNAEHMPLPPCLSFLFVTLTNGCQTWNAEPNPDPNSKISCYLCEDQRINNLPWPSDVGFSHQQHWLPHHFACKSRANVTVLHLDHCMEAHVSTHGAVTGWKQVWLPGVHISEKATEGVIIQSFLNRRKNTGYKGHSCFMLYALIWMTLGFLRA